MSRRSTEEQEKTWLDTTTKITKKNTKNTIFDLTKHHLEQTWEISGELATRALNQMNTFISDKQMKKNILKQYPIPSNIMIEKDVGLYMKLNHTDKNKTKTMCNR
jgi:hypothetical protein